MFMNGYDIDDALQRFEVHPVLGPATRTMAELRDWTNNNSDGWGYWKQPMRAAEKLMVLIQGDGTSQYYDRERDDVTAADLKIALRPIKRFRTQVSADFQIVEELPAPAQPEPVQPQSDSADVDDLAEVLAKMDLEDAWIRLSYQEQAAEILKRLQKQG